ncbi:TerD family protein [Brevibacillus porteri]|uniref:Tellurium resistance protein TerA n=1 Tax=Brevibacillus porteri TaxID=2126350 RepID=A0ABX5FYM3_9BACL|nr:TerD family protein [Brevibacillus porteri]MED1801024.1 TerD family protein [Brevibacillus porteri]MED2130410.1 TerD family protein [Brevibacillus porteri]MED2745159.1 TerD family protein [Brevibacillus porteri]MED2812650.1 TerD family protein [Brevibacillus porteri]MED2895376.1 TerD family protein [Brevibacillus porteri]
MGMTTIKGQKIDVTKSNPGLSKITVELSWTANDGLDLDASAFLIGKSGKVNKEEDFIFYSNPRSTNGSVSLLTGSSERQRFDIDLMNVPLDVEKIAFTLTIYDAVARNHSFNRVSSLCLRILHPSTNSEIIQFPFDSFTIENAIVAGELYRHQGQWKFNAIGSGFHGGLAALCGNFGIEVSQEKTPESKAPEPKPAPKPEPKPEPVVSTSPPISITKIELKKKGEAISLKKTSANLGQLLVNLNWNKGTKQNTGFFGRSKGIDLDLGCLFELSDGYKGCIQALGGNLGDYRDFPYIALDGDDRTGTRSEGENLRINGNNVKEFERILIYAFIYEGVAKWAETDGVVTITQADNPAIEVKMDVHDPRKGVCAVAMIERQGDTFNIRRLVEYFSGHQEMDRYYGWNMRWTVGSK